MNRAGFFANLVSSFREFSAQRFIISSPDFKFSKKKALTFLGTSQNLKGFKEISFYRRQKMGKRKRLIA